MSATRDSGRWPDVFIVGAGRSGTTTLHEILRQHSGVRVCDHKSPNYFVSGIDQPMWETPAALAMARQWNRDANAYRKLFSGASQEQVLVDASPVYMQARGVASRIHAVNPQARIIAILRDPSERAFAHFQGRRRDGIEPASTFEEWMDKMRGQDLPRDVAFGHYIGCGQYSHFLREYTELFGPERVLILFYEDLVMNVRTLVETLLDFIGVDATCELNTEVRANRSGEIRNPMSRHVWTATVGLRTRVRPLIPDSIRRAVGRMFLSDLSRSSLQPRSRAEVIALLEGDIRQLQQSTGRDLSSWLV